MFISLYSVSSKVFSPIENIDRMKNATNCMFILKAARILYKNCDVVVTNAAHGCLSTACIGVSKS